MKTTGVAYLKHQPFPSLIALTIRGKEGGKRALLTGRRSYQTTYTRSSAQYGEQTFPVVVVCKYSQGRYGRQGTSHFAYIVIGQVKVHPRQVFEVYRRRFGIESSYRLMNTMRARTSSTAVTLRLFYVGLALLLLSLWSYVKWHFLFVPKRGPVKCFTSSSRSLGGDCGCGRWSSSVWDFRCRLPFLYPHDCGLLSIAFAP